MGRKSCAVFHLLHDNLAMTSGNARFFSSRLSWDYPSGCGPGLCPECGAMLVRTGRNYTRCLLVLTKVYFSHLHRLIGAICRGPNSVINLGNALATSSFWLQRYRPGFTEVSSGWMINKAFWIKLHFPPSNSHRYFTFVNNILGCWL